MKQSSNSPNIFDRLKTETKEAHINVEEASGAERILDHTITPQGYQEFLERNYHAYTEVEQRVAQFAESPAVTHAQQHPPISTWIAKDLERKLPTTLSEITLDNRFECIGAIYVMEGSLLGGALLAKHLDKCTHLAHNGERHFHAANVTERSKRWKEFKTHVGRLSLSIANEDDVVLGAQKTFQIFECHFELSPVPKMEETV
ncbi:MAG: biliverdin-producing heme oxygenase [Marinirhabdus sp.]|nr:biliverdin-producing heme oxygenase [Marinirhabdus sp.]